MIDLDRIEEGKVLLKDVLAKTDSTLDQVYAHVFLALGAKAEGNLTLAREHAEGSSENRPGLQGVENAWLIYSGLPMHEAETAALCAKTVR